MIPGSMLDDEDDLRLLLATLHPPSQGSLEHAPYASLFRLQSKMNSTSCSFAQVFPSSANVAMNYDPSFGPNSIGSRPGMARSRLPLTARKWPFTNGFNLPNSRLFSQDTWLMCFACETRLLSYSLSLRLIRQHRLRVVYIDYQRTGCSLCVVYSFWRVNRSFGISTTAKYVS